MYFWDVIHHLTFYSICGMRKRYLLQIVIFSHFVFHKPNANANFMHAWIWNHYNFAN